MNQLKVYIVNFQSSASPGGFVESKMEAFHQYLKDSADIAAYWNYIPLLYMVKSTLGADELAPKFVPFLGSRFIVAEIATGNVNGQLPSEAWNWIYFDHDATKPRTISGGGLAGMLGL